MAGVTTYSPSGNAYADGVQIGLKWDTTSLTFSFPTAASNYGAYVGGFGEPFSGFQAFTSTQQDAVRKILSMYAECVPFTFTEITETDSVHADLRFAETDVLASGSGNPPAWCDYPGTDDNSGDAWFRHVDFDNPAPGNYAWLTFLHEIGHGLGLKHAHESSGAFGLFPADKRWLEWTVMSYSSFLGDPPGGGYLNETWGFPSTPMWGDILALQQMYGVNTATRTGNTVWQFNPTTGELKVDGVAYLTPGGNRILCCIPWDGGGVNTLDCSLYTTTQTIDLLAGMGSVLSSTQIASLGSGEEADANFYIYALDGSDTDSLPSRIIPGSGNTTIICNANTTLALTGTRSQYTVSEGGGMFTYTDTRIGTPNGVAIVTDDCAFIEFSDQTITPAASVNRLRMLWAS